MDVLFKLIQSVFTALIVLLVFGQVILDLFRLGLLWMLPLRSCRIFEGLSFSWLLLMPLEGYRVLLLLFQLRGQYS